MVRIGRRRGGADGDLEGVRVVGPHASVAPVARKGVPSWALDDW